jgi:hypothetical protein
MSEVANSIAQYDEVSWPPRKEDPISGGIVPHPIRLNPRPCMSCGVSARGFECRQCHEVCCTKCLSEQPGTRCPKCGGLLAPQKSCVGCGLVALPGVGIPGDLNGRCASCGLNYCSDCRKALPSRSFLGVFTARICSYCTGNVVDPWVSRFTS